MILDACFEIPKLLESILNSPCIMYVQYIGGCSVHRGYIMSTSGGYREYIGGISSVHRRMFSTSGDIMINVEDTMSTSGDVQYIGEIP